MLKAFNIKLRASALLAALLVALVSLAAAYRPNSQVKSYITVRSSASAQAKEIGRIQKTDVFEVTEFKGGWGKVVTESGTVGYVNAKFIEKVPETPINQSTTHSNSPSWNGGNLDLHWMVWLILALVVAVFAMQKCDLDGEVSIWVTPIMWFLLGFCELFYLVFCHDPLWTNANLGWLAIIIAAVVFAFSAFYQTGSMIGFAKIYSEDNAAVGIWSVPVCAVGGIILGFTAPDYLWIAFAAFGVAQLFQAYIIFSTVNEYQGAGLATVSALGYLFGMLGTIVMATLLLVLVAIVLIGIFVLWIVLSMLGSSNSDIRLTHKWGDYFSDQYGNEWEYIGGDRYRRT